jgi:hypothetical protein
MRCGSEGEPTGTTRIGALAIVLKARRPAFRDISDPVRGRSAPSQCV